MESMQKLWEFYTAPEGQTGLIERKAAVDPDVSVSEDISNDDDNSDDYSLTIKGNFSYGVTPKLD
jgi:hypothetical protein